MERKLKPLNVEHELEAKGMRLFTPEEFRRLFGVTLRAAQEFIKDHGEDLFLKLRNGLYALRYRLPHDLEIANRLYVPSYISFEFALAHYGMIPETVYTITSATTKITRGFLANDISYEYSRIKKSAYTGYRLVKVENSQVLIATPEKALADYYYFVDLGLKSPNERLRVGNVNKRETYRCAKLFERLGVLQLIEEIL